MNMPFELGIDLGCRDYHPNALYRQKKILILESERYSTQKALSDLSFADCKCHENDEELILFLLREWFLENGFHIKESGTSMWEDYNYFISNVFEKKLSKGFKKKDIELMSIAEFMLFIREYLGIN